MTTDTTPEQQTPETSTRPPGLLRRMAAMLLLALLCALGGLGWLTSPWGEGALTALTLRVGNAALAPQGLSMSLGSVGGLWDGELRLWDLALADSEGEWLLVPAAVLRPGSLSIMADAGGHRRVGVALLQVTNAAFNRAPHLPPSTQPQTPAPPGPLELMPAGLRFELDNLELLNARLGEGADAVYVSTQARGFVARHQAALRLSMDANSRPLGALPPAPGDLPEDVTMSLRDLRAAAGGAGQGTGTGMDAGAETDAQAALQAPSATVGEAAPMTPDTLPATVPSAPVGASLSLADADAGGASGAGDAPPAGADAGTGTDGAAAQAAAQPVDMRSAIAVDWDTNYGDVRIKASDTFVLLRFFPGIQRLWARSRVQVFLPQWPPDRAHPVQVRLVSRFGLSSDMLGERVRASLLSGQVYWDGSRMVLRDVDLAVPTREPRVRVQGSAGMDRQHGPGARMTLRLADMQALMRSLGQAELAQDLGGSLQAHVDVSRGGRHDGWWLAPLPEPAPFAAHPLPGFAVALPMSPAAPDAPQAAHAAHAAHAGGAQASAPPAAAPATSAGGPGAASKPTAASGPRPEPIPVAGARASLSPTALHMSVRVSSPALKLPGGVMENVDLTLQGSSVEADTAPEGTARRRNSAAAKGESPGTAGHGGTPPANGAAASDADAADFTALGLPRALVGTVRLSVGSLMGLGEASVYSRWMAAGMHSEADIFQMQLDGLHASLPGVRLAGDMGAAYALPRRRVWPWLDGELTFDVDNWNTLARLVDSPVRGEGVGLRLKLESLFDEKGRARQYMQAKVGAAMVMAPTFTVRGVRGDVTSQHVHALADVLALRPGGRAADNGSGGAGDGSASAGGNAPNAPIGNGTATPAEATSDLSLLDARLQMGSGSGGPVNWESGQCSVLVAGEDARVEARLAGALQAALMATYNFRERLLKVQRMEMSHLLKGTELAGKDAAGPADKSAGAVAQNAGQSGQPGTTPAGQSAARSGGRNAAQNAPQTASGGASAGERVGLRLTHPLTVALADGVRVDRLDMALQPGGTLHARGTFADNALHCVVDLRDMPLALPRQALLAFAGDASLADIPDGQLDLRVRLEGSPQAPTGTLGLDVTQVRTPRLPSLPPLALRVRGQLEKAPRHSVLALRATVEGLPGQGAAPGTPAAATAAPGPAMASATAGAAPDEAAATAASGTSPDAAAPVAQPSAQSVALPTADGFTATARIPLHFAPAPRLAAEAPLTAQAAWRGDIAPLWRLVPLPGRSFSGRGAVAADVRGTLAAPQWKASVRVEQGRYVDLVDGVVLQQIDMDANSAWQGDSALRLSAADGQGGTVRLDGRLTQGPGGLRVSGQGQVDNLRPLRRDDLALALTGKLALDGPLAAPGPLLSGDMRLEGAFQLLKGFTVGVRSLENVEQGQCVNCPPPQEALTATRTASGSASAARAAPGSVTAAGSASGSAPDSTRVASGSASAATARPPVKTAGKPAKNTAKKTARATADKAAAVTPAAPEGAPLALPRLDVRISAPGHFFIRGRGLDSEWKADLHVTGTAAQPRLMGYLAPVRGALELMGRQFRFDKGSITFDGGTPPNPALDLTLAYQSAQITALVQVRGTGRRPQLDLSSQPALPRDEVMAQVLFGKSMGSLSRFEAIQAAAAAAQLVDSGPSALDVMGSTRDMLGLEVLRFGSASHNRPARAPGAGGPGAPKGGSASADAEDSTVLEAGKYLTDNVYVGLEQGLRPEEGTAVRVEVELSPHISFSGRTSQQSSGVGLDWKMDY